MPLGSGHYLWPGWGLKRKRYVPLKKIYPTICYSQVFFTPPKENSKANVHLRFNMVYVSTLPTWSKIILLPHLTQLIFFSYPTILSSVPTPVINNDRSLSVCLYTSRNSVLLIYHIISITNFFRGIRLIFALTSLFLPSFCAYTSLSTEHQGSLHVFFTMPFTVMELYISVWGQSFYSSGYRGGLELGRV